LFTAPKLPTAIYTRSSSPAGWEILLSIYEYGHVFLLSPFLFRFFSGSEFSFALCHDGYCSVYLA